jgi:cytochrome c oxidase subunit II
VSGPTLSASVGDGVAHRVPLDYFFNAAGPASIPVRHLNWALTALAVIVCVIIAGLLAYALWRRRSGTDADQGAGTDAATGTGTGTGAGKDTGKDTISPVLPDSGRGAYGVLIGTAISIAALVAATIYTLWTLGVIAQPGQGPVLRIEVTGYDWWWKIAYPAQDGAAAFVTANEIHVPVGVPVQVDLKSADVLHAFWVPALAGKTETVPGQVNRQWIEADKPGVYRGQCSQYCGAQHAHMGFEVVADTPADFAAWRARQIAPASSASAPTTSPSVQIGMHLFNARCAGCHTVRGTPADGVQAPDLTHLATRRSLAALTLPNTREDLLAWITAPQRIKPEALMPATSLNTADANALLDYLETLK